MDDPVRQPYSIPQVRDERDCQPRVAFAVKHDRRHQTHDEIKSADFVPGGELHELPPETGGQKFPAGVCGLLSDARKIRTCRNRVRDSPFVTQIHRG